MVFDSSPIVNNYHFEHILVVHLSGGGSPTRCHSLFYQSLFCTKHIILIHNNVSYKEYINRGIQARLISHTSVRPEFHR